MPADLGGRSRYQPFSLAPRPLALGRVAWAANWSLWNDQCVCSTTLRRRLPTCMLRIVTCRGNEHGAQQQASTARDDGATVRIVPHKGSGEWGLQPDPEHKQAGGQPSVGTDSPSHFSMCIVPIAGCSKRHRKGLLVTLMIAEGLHTVDQAATRFNPQGRQICRSAAGSGKPPVWRRVTRATQSQQAPSWVMSEPFAFSGQVLAQMGRPASRRCAS